MARKERSKGKNRLFYLAITSEDGTPQLLEGQTAGSLNITNSSNEVTAIKDEEDTSWSEAIDGVRGWSASVSIARLEKETDNQTQLALVRYITTKEDTTTPVYIGKIDHEAQTFTGFVGEAIITNYSEDYPVDSDVTASLDLTGNGKIEWVEDSDLSPTTQGAVGASAKSNAKTTAKSALD